MAAKHIASDIQWADLISKIKAKIELSDILDLLYPIGSYFVTSDLTFEPASLWGGTWEISGQVISEGGEVWSSIGEVWDSVGTKWTLDGVIVNRWHRVA